MPNRLASETSPYLLQHAHNPVEWYPWGSEAIERARREDRPIFLSIGYAACHWCHVMEHESFEDAEIAKLMNDRFVCVKVDREERPDLDQIYMNAVQLITGRGGWPMSVFLTPDLQPFYGGTYWPPRAGRGMPGFDQILLAVDDAWNNRRQLAIEQAQELTNHLRSNSETSSEGEVSFDLLYQAAVRLEQNFDFRHGGFGGAPKFPHPMDLQVLLRVWQRTGREGLLNMVRTTLDKMSRGGIYDHLAGGFARYSVDERWLVPHFEKMLYDNALLSSAYIELFQATHDPHYARVAQETLDYLLTYMLDPCGGFHSTEDADSEGEEGKFYVWSPEEVLAELGEDAGQRFNYVYDVSPGGNFEGHSILNMPKTLEQCATLRGWNMGDLERELEQSRRKLLRVRDQRIRPGKDDKILVSWNALAIDALARATCAFSQPRYLEAAIRSAQFIVEHMRRADGRLLHSYRAGQAKLAAYLDDYMYLINSLVSLYEATFDEHWIDIAAELADVVLERFAAPAGGFYFTANDHEELLTRNLDFYDSSVPSSNGMAATALVRLGRLCGRQGFLDAARRTVEAAGSFLKKAPTASAQLLIASDMLVGPTREYVIVGGESAADLTKFWQAFHQKFIPNRVIACRASPGKTGSPHLDPIFVGKNNSGSSMSLYVCENFSCQAPLVGLNAAMTILDDTRQ